MSTHAAASPPPLVIPVEAPEHAAVASPAAFTAQLHEGLDTIAARWRAFQAEGGCTAYQRLEWVEGIVTTLMPPAKTRPLIVEITERSSGRTVMILPLAMVRRATHTTITWLDCGVCDYAAPLLAPGFSATAAEAEAAWSAALAVLPPADLVQIERIPDAVGTQVNPLSLLRASRLMALQSFGVAIEGPPETLIKRLCRPSTSQNLKKTDRKLSQHGAVRFVAATSDQEVAAVFDALLDQRRQRFRDLGRVDLLDRPEVRTFYQEAAHGGLRGGPARLFGVAVGDQWIATALGLVHGGAFHGILLAMDTQWRNFSPGLRIATDIMVWARQEGLDYFDMTIGDLPYKATLGATPRALRALSIARSTRGWLIRASWRGASGTKAWLQARPQLFEPLRAARQRVRRWTSRAKPPV